MTEDIAGAQIMPIIDTHCHLGVYESPLVVLDQARSAGVHTIAVTEDPGQYRLLRTRLGRREGVEVALGMHPLRAGDASPHDLARFFRLLPKAGWIGEIGLDFSSAGAATCRRQLQVFEALLAEPIIQNLPVTVHSRGAERDTITRLAQVPMPAILHWYTGPVHLVDEALAAGLWFSVNPAMIRSRRAAALLRLVPAERVLLETDGPFVRQGRRPAAPADLAAISVDLARLWNTTSGQAGDTLRANQRRFMSQYGTAEA